MQKIIFITTLILTCSIFFSCEKNSSSSDLKTLVLSEEFKEQAVLGSQAFDILATGNEIEDLTGTSGLEYEIPDYENPLASIQHYRGMFNEVVAKISPRNGLTKPTEDSLYFFFHNSLTGEKIALYYDSETDTARAYFVRYKFPPAHWLEYDSTEVKALLNYTLENGSDDIIISVYNKKDFKDNMLRQTEISEIVVTDRMEQGVTGIEVTHDIYFRSHPHRDVIQIHRFVDANPDLSATLSETFYFDDGTSFSRSVTFNPDNTGSFSKAFRNGLTVTGTFDSAKDDGEGAFTETIIFPETNEILDQIYKSAVVSITPDSVFNGEFEKFVYFDSGRIDSFHVTIQVVKENDTKTTTLTMSKPNGAHGSFTAVEDSLGTTLEGVWTFWNDYYAEVNATFNSDGSADIYYSVYDPDDVLVLTAEFHISPDGTGEGIITKDGETYTVTLKGNGKATIHADGYNDKTIDIY